MTPLGRRLLSSVVVYPHERSTVFLMFAYSFLAMTSYNIIKPATRSSFIVELGAENLPFVMLAAGLLMGGLMHLYSRVVNVIPSRWVIPGTQAVIIAMSVMMWFLLRTGQAWVSAAFFFWGLLLGLFLISQFWTLANDLFDARQAKRLFGFIGGGASLGGLTGAATTALTAGRFGTDNLVLVSVCPMLLCFVVARHVSSKASLTVGRGHEPSASQFRGREALGLLRQSKHLRLIAGVVGAAAMSAVVLDQQLSMAAEVHVVREDAITSFLAQVAIYTSLIGLIIQVGLTNRVYRRLGISFALMVLPASLGVTGVVMLLFPVLWAPALARVLNSSLRYTLDKTSREILFLPLPTEVKHSAKPFVDVAVDRFIGKGLGSVVLLVLLKLFNLTWYQLSYVSLALMVFWIVLAHLAQREYLTTFRRQLSAQRFAPDQMVAPQVDLASLDLLDDELGHPEEARVLHAIDMLDSLDQTQYVTPLMLRHHSPRVRAKALDVLARGSSDVAQRWEATVEHLLRDDSADVRAAAVQLLSTIRQENVSDLMRPYLAHRDPRVVASATVALGNSDHPGDIEMAAAAIEQLAHGRPAVRRAALKEWAHAVARIPGPRSLRYLVRLLRDPDWDVALEAIHSVQHKGDPEHALVPELVRLLPDRRLRHAARRALAGYGEDVVETLRSSLRDPTIERRVRWQLTSTLALIPCQQSVQALMDTLADPDGLLRYRTARALGKLRREQDGLRFESDLVEESAIRTSAGCLRRIEQLRLVHMGRPPEGSLLIRAMFEDIGHLREHLFELLSLIYPWREIGVARWAIETGDQVHRAGAVEFLDNVLSHRLRQQTMPLFDRPPLIDDAGGPLDATITTAIAQDLGETLSGLILDEHPVISACAIEMVHERNFSNLDHVLERVRGEPTGDPWVVESAARVLSTPRPVPHTFSAEAHTTLDIVKKLSVIPTLAFVPVQELFHLADQLEQIRYQPGQTLFEEGDRADRIELVLDGELVLREQGVASARVVAGDLVGLEEILSERPMRQAARARTPSICLSKRADTFLALLADHAGMTEGLFRYYLGLDSSGMEPIVRAVSPPEDLFPALATRDDQPLSVAQKALLLEQTLVFPHATGESLLALSRVTTESRLRQGDTLFGGSDAPSIYIVLSGELSIERPGRPAPLTAGPGVELGVVPTLTGRPMDIEAHVVREGVALRVLREDVFEFLGDHVALLQDVFSALLRGDRQPSPGGQHASSTDQAARP